MNRLVEYYNPNPFSVQLIGPDKKQTTVPRYGKIVLSDWFITRYTPKYLRVVKILGPATPKTVKPSRPVKRVVATIPRPPKQVLPRVRRSVPSIKPAKHTARSGSTRTIRTPSKPIVGHALRGDISAVYQTALEADVYSISNNIGVGILSYNRLGSLQRLIESIRKHTDLSRTTIFVSDESSKQEVKDWLAAQSDIVTVHGTKRLGVAGNTNRLLRCLARFKYKLVLNDDVEVLRSGWDLFYFDAMVKSGFHHFCYRQAGVYGAVVTDGSIKQHQGVSVRTITAQPQGSILALDQTVFDAVGYFDERFGLYGMEHVDWSKRVEQSGVQPTGFHDVVGADGYFRIWNEESAVENRHKHLQESKALLTQVSAPGRIRVEASNDSAVPSVSYVIPVRNIGRQEAIGTIVANIRAQRFPCVEINLIEQDQTKKVDHLAIGPCQYKLATNNDHFNKALAFNHGVAQAKHEIIIMHDADIMVPSDYTQDVWKVLQTAESCHLGSKVLYLTPQSSQEVSAQHKASKTAKCEHAVDYFEGGTLACTKQAYVKVGGFDEKFVGYGVEDCEFYDRLKRSSNFKEDRRVTLLHLWHDRVGGWQEKHHANRVYLGEMQAKYTIEQRCVDLRGLLRSRYGL